MVGISSGPAAPGAIVCPGCRPLTMSKVLAYHGWPRPRLCRSGAVIVLITR